MGKVTGATGEDLEYSSVVNRKCFDRAEEFISREAEVPFERIHG